MRFCSRRNKLCGVIGTSQHANTRNNLFVRIWILKVSLTYCDNLINYTECGIYIEWFSNKRYRSLRLLASIFCVIFFHLFRFFAASFQSIIPVSSISLLIVCNYFFCRRPFLFFRLSSSCTTFCKILSSGILTMCPNHLTLCARTFRVIFWFLYISIISLFERLLQKSSAALVGTFKYSNLLVYSFDVVFSSFSPKFDIFIAFRYIYTHFHIFSFVSFMWRLCLLLLQWY